MIAKRMVSRTNPGSRLACCLLAGWLLVGTTGCSTLGLSIWPAQFPLLTETRDMAANSPLPAALPHELSKTELADYYLEPGDRILIEPDQLDSELTSFGDQKIQLDGTIDLGKFGRMKVAGVTVEQVEGLIEEVVAQVGKAEEINVQLVEANAAEVYVLGEVGSPAAYPIEGHEHVLDVILRAGGLTSRASPCDIILVRPTGPDQCRVVLPVCYRQITQVGDVSTNYQLQPGDRIVVGSRTLWEELAFWKLNVDCQRCSRSCCVECEPGKAQYQRRFFENLAAFFQPAPGEQEATEEIGEPVEAKRENVGSLDFKRYTANR